jgi:glycine cleavage system H protein
MAETGQVLEGLFYTKEHEWVSLKGSSATVGITDHAQHELGDIVYVEMPEVGAEIKALGEMGVIESVKAASDLYSPVAGKVAEVNPGLESHPEHINNDPYGKGWIAKITVAGTDPLAGLMDAKAYTSYLERL